MDEVLERLTSFLSRKFIIAVLALVFLTFFIDVDPKEKLGAIIWIVGLFSAAQSSQNISGIMRG